MHLLIHLLIEGNTEYVVLRNYSSPFSYSNLMWDSYTPTQMQSFRTSDQALAWCLSALAFITIIILIVIKNHH